MSFARRVFFWAAIYGFLALIPQYLLEGRNGRDYPPAITHPEYYYGFLGVALAWQVAFLLVSKDPVRFRPLMLPAMLEKAGFGVAAVALYLGNRLALPMFGAGIIDLGLGGLFLLAYLKTPSAAAA